MCVVRTGGVRACACDPVCMAGACACAWCLWCLVIGPPPWRRPAAAAGPWRWRSSTQHINTFVHRLLCLCLCLPVAAGGGPATTTVLCSVFCHRHKRQAPQKTKYKRDAPPHLRVPNLRTHEPQPATRLLTHQTPTTTTPPTAPKHKKKTRPEVHQQQHVTPTKNLTYLSCHSSRRTYLLSLIT